MRPSRKLAPLLLVFLTLAGLCAPPLHSQSLEKRVALVIGNGDYQGSPLATARNDADLVARALAAVGFDVTNFRDLDEASLRKAFRAFVEKAAASGPGEVAVVYFAGYGVQLEGDNYLIPVRPAILRDADIPLEALRVSDYAKSLAALELKTGVVILDAARPFSVPGASLAEGLAPFEPGKRLMLAFNAVPGTVALPEKGPNGVYAYALSAAIRNSGLPLKEAFEKVRQRVAGSTRNALVPWNSGQVETSFAFSAPVAEKVSLSERHQAPLPSRRHYKITARHNGRSRTQQSVVGGALGALAGAVVAGPVGLVAGAMVGAAAAPAIANSSGHPRR